MVKEVSDSKHSKRIIIYLLVMILFVVLLYNANMVVGMVIKDDMSLTQTDFSSIESVSTVYYSLDNFEFYSDIFDTVSLTGWAFCETEQPNDSKVINVLLKSQDITYKSSNSALERPDVKGALPHLKVYNQFSGLETKFATFNMKNGVYELYLHVKENDLNYGLVNTGKKYRKDSKGFYEYDPLEVKPFNKLQETDRIASSIDVKTENDGKLYISGWAFLEGEDATDQNVYMLINLPNGDVLTHETARIMRNDVGNHFNDMKYSNSGFEVEIDMAKYDLEGADVKIIIDNNGLFVSETSVLLEF